MEANVAFDETTAIAMRDVARLEAENANLRAACADLFSVRDQFAVAAMKAMLAAGHDKQMRGYEGWREEFCAEAYRWADAMQAVRAASGVKGLDRG